MILQLGPTLTGGAFYLRSNGAAAVLAMKPPLRSSLPSRPRDFGDFGFTKQLINPISIAETSQRSVSLSAYVRSAKDLSILGTVTLS
jgi:hypothetical protein